MLHYLREPDTREERARGLCRAILLFLVFASGLVVVNALQIASVVIYPFSRKSFKDVNRYIADVYCRFIVWIIEGVYRIQFVLTGDNAPVGENVLVVANHQEMVDIPILMCFAWRKKSLGNLKWFAKEIIKYVPGPGWGMHFIDCIFLKRNWAKDRESVRRTFHQITHYNIPVWLVMFCEGTRATDEKLELSRGFAEAKGLVPPNYVMVPRTKGFCATVQGLRDHLDAVYDITIGFPDGIPTLTHLFKNYVRSVHVNVRRIPITDLPEDEEGLARWLIATYHEKDRLMTYFYQEKRFPGPVVDDPYRHPLS